MDGKATGRRPLVGNSVATIGFFDGVHRGHQYVIGKVAEEAHRRGLEAVVVTFDRHPREVIREALGLKGRFQSEAGKEGGGGLTLTPLEERRALIMKAGADRCEVLHFDQQLASLSAHDFMDTILQEQLGVKVLMLGYDNRFGHRTRGHQEGFNDYVGYGKELGIEVLKLEEWKEERKEERGKRRAEEGGDLHISSSAIREALRQGAADVAATLLGRPYSLRGQVVHGYGEGHRIGFPTANIIPYDPQQLIPANGVYAVNVTINNSTIQQFNNSIIQQFNNSTNPFSGMMNIGTRPTFNGQHRTLEVNIFDFDGDLYGQPLTIQFLRHIRSEQHFDTPEALRQQLEKDREAAEPRSIKLKK